MSETNKHNTLYLFDGSWPFTVITRNPDGKLHFSGSDDMPENIDDDMGDPGFYVFDGTVFDAEGWTPEQCAAAGISSEAARYSEWWHGSMKPATLADVAHVFALATLHARCAQYEAVVGAATTALGSLEWAAAKVDKLYSYITRRNAETVVCKSLTGLSEHLHVSAVALNNTVRALAATTPEGEG